MEKMRQPDLRKFMIDVVIHRKKLIGLDVSHKNQMLMNNIIEQLYDRWLIVFPDATPEQLANFFVKNQEKFNTLMPGISSTHYAKFLYNFNSSLEYALNLLTDLPSYYEFKQVYRKFQDITTKTFGKQAAAQVLIHNVPEEYFITKTTLKDTIVHKALDLGGENILTFKRPK